MKHLFALIFVFIILTLSFGQDLTTLTLDQISIYATIEDRTSVGIDSAFSDDFEKEFCHTRICGAENSVTVFHFWYFDGIEKAKACLSVKMMN